MIQFHFQAQGFPVRSAPMRMMQKAKMNKRLAKEKPPAWNIRLQPNKVAWNEALMIQVNERRASAVSAGTRQAIRAYNRFLEKLIDGLTRLNRAQAVNWLLTQSVERDEPESGQVKKAA